jgi:transposase
MSLRPQQPLPPVPEETVRVAHAAFRTGNPCILLRDRLGGVFKDDDFADLFPRRGQPAYAPWRLALVTLLQFREGLSDRQAAEAVRARIDWKYLLALGLDDPGFDHSVLCEFRGRLLAGEAAERLLARVVEAARGAGLLKARGRQRTDSTHVLAAVRELNRIELLAETLRAALNAIAVVAPGWLRALAASGWYERYGRRIEDARLPEAGPKRAAYVGQVGADGFRLLAALDGAGAPPDAAALPAVAVLRRVWGAPLRARRGRPGAWPGRCPAASGPGPWPRRSRRIALRHRGPVPGEEWHELDGLRGPPDGELRRGRTAPCAARRHDAGRPTCTRRRGRRRSTGPSRPRAWPRLSTRWTPPTSAPTTSSPPASGTAST